MLPDGEPDDTLTPFTVTVDPLTETTGVTVVELTLPATEAV
jgi:hypothetical protein